MKFIVLGGSNCQVALIKGLKSRGHEIILLDYYKSPPGKNFADYKEEISTFDIDGICEIARKYKVDGILTAGTDQPVFSGAVASEKLGLNFYIDSIKARELTNKKFMKKIFTENNIPTVNYKYIDINYTYNDLSEINFPAVIKPFDSQGQRGVLKINSFNELKKYIQETFSYTTDNQILIEEFYENDEITVSGWVNQGKTHILSITDRVTYDCEPNIGICTSHNFPSKHYEKYKHEIIKITKDLVSAFDIKNGPIYFQMLIGKNGVLVNETAARIGGAFEDVYIKYLTGVDMHELLINNTLGINNHLDKENYMDDVMIKLNVELFFANKGRINKISGIENLLEDEKIIDGAFNFSVGDSIGVIRNATERAGHFIVSGETSEVLNENISYAFDHIQILDECGNNLIIKTVK